MTTNVKEPSMLNHRLFPLSLIALATLAACAMTPPKESLLEQARGSYATAQSDPQVVKFATDELNQAGAALNKANDAWTKGESAAQVDQLAYLAKQRVAIAQETTKQKTADLAAASASTERERIRLDARTTEADEAQRKAATAQRNADASQRSAEASQRSAEASQREAVASQRQTQDAEARSRQLEAQLKELDAKKTARGLEITLADVLFDTDKAQLRSGGRGDVQVLVGILK